MLIESFHLVRKNYGALLVYLGATIALNTVKQVADILCETWLKEPAHVQWMHLYDYTTLLLLMVAYSVLQTLVFAKVGADIDRPLWRVADPREALQRFLPLWLIINLSGMLILQSQHLFANGDPTGSGAALCVFGYLTFAIVYIPLGACLMFYGRKGWSDAPRSFSPLVHELPRTIMLLFFSSLQVILMLGYVQVQVSIENKWIGVAVAPLFDAASGLVELMVFAGTWMICMLHRERGEDANFDF